MGLKSSILSTGNVIFDSGKSGTLFVVHGTIAGYDAGVDITADVL